MRISGYGERITAIDTQDGEGDHSEMTIVEQAPLTARRPAVLLWLAVIVASALLVIAGCTSTPT